MLMEERHEKILQLLQESGRISTAIIQRKFQVGYGTAQRDMRILEEKGLITRTAHGGAIPYRHVAGGGADHSLSSAERCAEVTENYLAIARRAAEMIGEGDTIFLTHASIGYLIAANLPALRCTVVTNSISIADALRTNEQASVLLTGGEMSGNGNFYDTFTLEMLRRLRFDKCFVTSAGISAAFGLSSQSPRNAEILNTVLDRSAVAVGLYPAQKFGTDSAISLCPAARLHTVVTEPGVPEEAVNALRELEIQVEFTRGTAENG